MTQTDRERIEELATAYVCPLNFSPSTPYELGMVRTYTTFALMVIEALGYTRRSRHTPDRVEAVKRELERLLRLDEEVVEWINSKDHPGTKEMR